MWLGLLLFARHGRQERPVPAARLAARRHGRPDARFSAMIHAATMVSAGVYLMIRMYPLLSAGWMPGGALTPPMLFMAVIGAFTALFAATIAVAQNDIKKVLAYSTISPAGLHDCRAWHWRLCGRRSST